MIEQRVHVELNIAALIEYVVVHEFLMERYKETELFKYMVSQVKPDIVMLLNGTNLEDLARILQKKLVSPATVDMIEEIRKLPHREMES